MAAKRIPRTPKPDLSHNNSQALPEPEPKTTRIAVLVAKNTYILTTPGNAERVKKKFNYIDNLKF